MGLFKIPQRRPSLVILLLFIWESHGGTLHDVLNLNDQLITRIARDTQYTGNRYDSTTSGRSTSLKPLKPEDAPEARDRDGANVEKRCIRCDYYNNRDNRYPYDSRSRYEDRYDDRYDDRYYSRDRYDDRNRDRYDDYDRRYYEIDRKYNDYDRRYDDRDRYDRDRYDRRPDYYDFYERDRYDRDDRYRYYDKYNRGSSSGYRPWDETTRGSSGFDSSGRGYYFAIGRPDYSNYGYASSWNYGNKNSSRDRWREQGFSSGSYRPRDPYDPGHRGTSYLYGRPSSTTTTQSPSSSGGNTVTDNPQAQSNTSSG